MKLVLFDIDGTLLWSDGAGRRAVFRALTEVFGTTGPDGHRFDGKTDPQIVRELMKLAGVAEELIEERLDLLLDRYVLYLREELAAPGHHSRALPGVHELLDVLEAREDVILGLLTGNLAEGAHAKLVAVGIDPERFRVGAYGSDHHFRPELPAIAIQRLREQHALDVPGHDVIVIGDTPADLTCGLAVGARAIGVATGRYTLEELAEHDPHALFADLRETHEVVEAIVRRTRPG